MFSSYKTIVFLFSCLLIPNLIFSQSAQNETRDIEKEFSIFFSTNLIIQKATPSTTISNSQELIQRHEQLFFDAPLFTLGMDWNFKNNFSINPKISFFKGNTKNSFDRTGGFFIGLGPDIYDVVYDFSLITLEPNIKYSLSTNNLDLFWTTGPILGLGMLNLNGNAGYLQAGEIINQDVSSQENKFNVGINFSTGINYWFSKSFGAQVELGYRYLNLGRYKKFSGSINNFDVSSYKLDGITPSIGISYKL